MKDKTLVEGAGAVGLAAILEDKIPKSSKNIGIVVVEETLTLEFCLRY